MATPQERIATLQERAHVAHHRHSAADLTDVIQASQIDAAIARDSEVIAKTIVDAKGDLISATAADTPVRKAAGANNTFLTADSVQSDGLAWRVLADSDIPSTIARDSEAVLQTLADAKGDIVAASAADVFARVAVGTNGLVLVAASAETAGVKWGRPKAVGCRVVRTVDQAGVVSGGAGTAVVFDAANSTETFDTDAFHDPATNPSRLTVPVGLAGYYAIAGTVAWDSNATGRRGAAISVSGTQVRTATISAGVTGILRTHVTDQYLLAEADYVELIGQQDSGANRTFQGGTTILSLTFIGTS